MYLTPDERTWCCDIEADSLTPTKVWCMCAINVITREEVCLVGSVDIQRWINEKKAEGCKFIFHNGLGYDAPALNKLLGTRLTVADIIDTLVLSMLFSPSLDGGHSLDAWGLRVGREKTKFNEFHEYSERMLTYCLNDTHVGLLTYLELVKRMLAAGFTEEGIRLEHQAWAVLQTQKRNGFFFNIEEAHILMSILVEEVNDLKDRIYERWPPKLELIATYGRPRKKDGEFTKNYERHVMEYERVDIAPDGASYACYGYVSFNLGSPDQRVEKLLELGWKPGPNELTKGGNPQPTRKGKLAPSLERLARDSGNVEITLLANWIDVNARLSMIKTWIEAYDPTTGCIHGSLWLAGTHRYRHSEPNTANIPGVRLKGETDILMGREGVWTYESRDLWCTRDRVGRRMVGVDAKGIQLRVLCNYLNNETFTRNILSADPHEANRKDFGLPTRSLAKTICYAILMGAGDGRISTEAKVSMSEAKAAKELFFSRVPELKRLIARLKGELKRSGRIKLCDGSRILVPSDHMVIPYLLQGDESKIMKYAMVRIQRECKRLGIDALQVGMIHDELQYDVDANQTEAFVAVALEAFEAAGRFFQYNVPIAGDAKIGLTWAETH